jgi:hypothetical protein
MKSHIKITTSPTLPAIPAHEQAARRARQTHIRKPRRPQPQPRTGRETIKYVQPLPKPNKTSILAITPMDAIF